MWRFQSSEYDPTLWIHAPDATGSTQAQERLSLWLSMGCKLRACTVRRTITMLLCYIRCPAHHKSKQLSPVASRPQLLGKCDSYQLWCPKDSHQIQDSPEPVVFSWIQFCFDKLLELCGCKMHPVWYPSIGPEALTLRLHCTSFALPSWPKQHKELQRTLKKMSKRSKKKKPSKVLVCSQAQVPFWLSDLLGLLQLPLQARDFGSHHLWWSSC